MESGPFSKDGGLEFSNMVNRSKSKVLPLLEILFLFINSPQFPFIPS